MSSEIERGMNIFIDLFHKYSSKDGDCETMSKEELKEFLQKEFGTKMDSSSDKKGLDKLFEGLDRDKSNAVDFCEFVEMIACMTVLCHETHACLRKGQHAT